VAVSYQSGKESGISRGEVFIQAEDCSLSIPIVALPPSSRIAPHPTTIDLRRVGLNSICKFQFTLSNLGMLDGTFKLTCEDESVQIMLTSGSRGWKVCRHFCDVQTNEAWRD
jgi:hypothetical protein